MSRNYYCWRCKLIVPMLTDDEWEQVYPFLNTNTKNIKAHQVLTGASVTDSIHTLRQYACDQYFKITGFRETNSDTIWHHRLSIYGAECLTCGHLLRSEHATYCANCGRKV
jgi:hypothetical protein